jgi:hypothetical protein
MSDVLSSTPSIQLQGIVHPDSYFQIVERNEIDWQLWIDVLHGKVAGAIFRGVLNQELRQQICHNFWRSLTLKQQGDGLPSYYEAFIGSSVTKPLEVYLDEVEQVRQDVQELFANTGDFFEFLLGGIRQRLADQGCLLRVAQHDDGRKAGECKIKSWGRKSGAFVLEPHDDEGPFRSPHLQGFEIGQLVGRTVSVNICLENGEGGDLHYWNISPNDQTREALGFKYDNIGYPLEALVDFDKLVLSIRDGDIYLFDSTKIHAVGQLTNEKAKRLTLLWFMGFRDPTTVIYWA